jgi:large subunit ribosomal protein L5
MPARLRERYQKDVAPALMRDLQLENALAVPRLEKIVLNMGLGEATQNPKILDSAVEELGAITGQKPVVTRAKKAIANFKLREDVPIGAMVTLRGERMYEFFDRLVNVTLPRVRDFKGVPDRSFDGRGNYSLGLREQVIFPEINLDKVDKIKGSYCRHLHDGTHGRRREDAAARARHAVPGLRGTWRRHRSW